MQSPQSTKFIFLFNPNSTMSTQALKIIYNICAVISLIFITLFFYTCLSMVLGGTASVSEFLYLILYGLHYPIFILGMIFTLTRQRIDNSFKVLVAMQIIFIIDMIVTTINVCTMLIVLIFYFDYFGSVYVIATLLYLAHIVPIGFATLFFYFYFKRTVTEGATNTVSDFTTGAYIPPSSPIQV
jgi:hypothetical protein